MAEIAKGRFDHRIDEKRNDEFGMLYTAFDNMAQALQRREGGGSRRHAVDADAADARHGAPADARRRADAGGRDSGGSQG